MLEDIPDLMLDDQIVATPGFGDAAEAGIELVTPNRLVSLLPRFLSTLDEVDRIDWNPDKVGIPSEAWLTQFYKYLADHAKDCDLHADVLLEVPLVPDQFGSLWAMGHESTLVGSAMPIVDSTLELDFHLHIEGAALEVARHLIELFAFEFNAPSAPAPVNGHDTRIGTGRQTREKVTVGSVNAVTQLVTKVAQVEDQQPVAHPKAPCARCDGHWPARR